LPKLGMKPLRQSALVEATIAEIGRTGSLDVTVSQIARKAGVSSALAHHYFGSKDQIFIAAMRHILDIFGQEARQGMAAAKTPRDRLMAIIHASFSAQNFKPEIVSAWLSFYVKAQRSAEAQRLLRVYHRRLHSNLAFDLRKLSNGDAEAIAHSLAALIDGLYIRQALREGAPDGAAAVAMITDHLDRAIGRH